MKKPLVILSGGQDSTTCLFWAKHMPGVQEVHAVTFDYGQRHAIEIQSAQTVAAIAGVASHEFIKLPDGVLRGTSPLVNPDYEVGQYESAETLPGGLEDTFVPARNILFLTLAANRAFCLGCDALVIGVSQEDFGGYPDCRIEFINAMGKAINEGMPAPIEIKSPLITLDKEQTVGMAVDLDGCLEALAYSHTCYNGEASPCGGCHACLLRAKGFQKAGVPDPLVDRCEAAV
jgi:7-cyano-7-deazaguanine synthase